MKYWNQVSTILSFFAPTMGRRLVKLSTFYQAVNTGLRRKIECLRGVSRRTVTPPSQWIDNLSANRFQDPTESSLVPTDIFINLIHIYDRLATSNP